MNGHPEGESIPGVLPQMSEHYLKIHPGLQRRALDWLTAHVTKIPTRKQIEEWSTKLPVGPGYIDQFGRAYQEIPMDFIRNRTPSFSEANVDGNSITAEAYRAFRGMINGLSQEEVLEGLIGLEGFARQPKG